MKRLMAFLLVCVLAFSSTLALADDTVMFEPTELSTVAELLGYTKPSEWTAQSKTRAVFSIVIYLDYLKETGTDSSKADIDWEKNTFVIENSDTLGFVYCEKDGKYKALFYIPGSGRAGYDPSFSMSSDETVLPAVLKKAGCSVYQNSAEDMVLVLETLAGDN